MRAFTRRLQVDDMQHSSSITNLYSRDTPTTSLDGIKWIQILSDHKKIQNSNLHLNYIFLARTCFLLDSEDDKMYRDK